MRSKYLVAFLSLCAVSAQADTFGTTLDYIYAKGAGLTATGPWLQVDFLDTSNGGTCLAGNCVKVTLTALSSGATGMQTGYKISDVGFNLTNAANLSNITATYSSGVVGTAAFPPTPANFDGGGSYDFALSYPTSSPIFTVGSTSVYYLSGVGASITAAGFDDLSSTPAGNGRYTVAAHLQGIPVTTGTCSAWIGNSTSAAKGGPGVNANEDCSTAGTPTQTGVVPEPLYSGLALTGGLIGFAVFARRRFVA